jgi:hypothetical protein
MIQSTLPSKKVKRYLSSKHLKMDGGTVMQSKDQSLKVFSHLIMLKLELNHPRHPLLPPLSSKKTTMNKQFMSQEKRRKIG